MLISKIPCILAVTSGLHTAFMAPDHTAAAKKELPVSSFAGDLVLNTAYKFSTIGVRVSRYNLYIGNESSFVLCLVGGFLGPRSC